MPYLVFLVIFALWAMYEMRKSSNAYQARKDAFWERERAANDVRRQDISNLEYITIPFDSLPFDAAAQPPVSTCQDNINKLKDCKIVNLTGMSNTDLKLQYGAANLENLIEYDSNFTTLCSNLARWGQALYDAGDSVGARTIFEFGVSIRADVSNIYLTLGKIYLSEDNTDGIYELITQVTELNTLMKDSILQQLRELLETDCM